MMSAIAPSENSLTCGFGRSTHTVVLENGAGQFQVTRMTLKPLSRITHLISTDHLKQRTPEKELDNARNIVFYIKGDILLRKSDEIYK